MRSLLKALGIGIGGYLSLLGAVLGALVWFGPNHPSRELLNKALELLLFPVANLRGSGSQNAFLALVLMALWAVFVGAVLGSVFWMFRRAFQHRRAEPNASPNVGPAETSGSSGAGGGQPSVS